MGTTTAFAPGHLTGLFQIFDQSPDLLLRGARGSGISLDLGVYTTVTAKPDSSTSWTIKINGKKTDAFVSEKVLEKFKSKIESQALTIEHFVETPSIAGFGSSGGGALSLALAVNEAIGGDLTRIEAAQIAHTAEIECKTGLGSVFAAERGGFGITTKPGAPGIGAAKNYPNTDRLRVIYAYFGPIPTKEALGNPSLRFKINELGGKSVDELILRPEPALFMRLSRAFTEHIGLVTPRLRKVFEVMDMNGITMTMAMFGEVAFAVMDKEKAIEAASILERLGAEPVVVGIDEKGARITSTCS